MSSTSKHSHRVQTHGIIIQREFARFTNELRSCQDHDWLEVVASHGTLARSLIADGVALYHAAKDMHVDLLTGELTDFLSLYDKVTELLNALSYIKNITTYQSQMKVLELNTSFQTHYKAWSQKSYRWELIRVALDRVIRWCHDSANLLQFAKIVDTYDTFISSNSSLSDPESHADASAGVETLAFFVELSSYADLAMYLRSKNPGGGANISIDRWNRRWTFHSSKTRGTVSLKDALKAWYGPGKEVILEIPVLDERKADYELREDRELERHFEMILPALLVHRLFPDLTPDSRTQHAKEHTPELEDLLHRLLSERGRERVDPGPSHATRAASRVNPRVRQTPGTTPAYVYRGRMAAMIMRAELKLLEPVAVHDAAELPKQLYASTVELAQQFHVRSNVREVMRKRLQEYNDKFALLVEEGEKLRKLKARAMATDDGPLKLELEGKVAGTESKILGTRNLLKEMLTGKLQEVSDIFRNVIHMWSKPGLETLYRQRTSHLERISSCNAHRQIVAQARDAADYLTKLVLLKDIDSCLDSEQAVWLAMQTEDDRQQWNRKWERLMTLYQGYYKRKNELPTTERKTTPLYGGHGRKRDDEAHYGLRRPFGNFGVLEGACFRSPVLGAEPSTKTLKSIDLSELRKVDAAHNAKISPSKRSPSKRAIPLAKASLEASKGRRPKQLRLPIPFSTKKKEKKKVVFSNSTSFQAAPAVPMDTPPVPKRESGPRQDEHLGTWIPVRSAQDIQETSVPVRWGRLVKVEKGDAVKALQSSLRSKR